MAVLPPFVLFVVDRRTWSALQLKSQPLG